MSSVPIIHSTNNLATHSHGGCCKEHWVKITLIVFGLLFIIGGIIGGFYGLNAFVAFSISGLGWLISSGTALFSVIKCLRRIHREEEEIDNRINSLTERNRVRRRWLKLAGSGTAKEMQAALNSGTPPFPVPRLLAEAASAGNLELVRFFFAQGLGPRDTPGHTVFLRAVGCHDHQKGHALIDFLLKKDPSLIADRTKDGDFTPLHLAVLYAANHKIVEFREKVQLLIDSGADVHSTDYNGNTPLHFAVQGMDVSKHPPDLELLKILVEAGAKWDVVNDKGETPLDIMMAAHSTWYARHKSQLKGLSKK